MKVESYAKAGLLLSIASILAGAFVRATGSGDGCGATWPTCKGKIIPALSDTSELIEFSHRSVSGVLLVVTLIIFAKTRKFQKESLVRTVTNYLTFFVIFEALIGAVIVIFEWVGLNSSLPRIIAVPIHLVNTFGLLGSYAILYKILQDDLQNIKNMFNKNFLLISSLFLLSGATGSITALADVLFPSASFVEGFLADFDRTSEVLTRLRILHPIISSTLSIVLYVYATGIRKKYNVSVKPLQTLILIAVFLGVINVLSNIVLPLSILHLAIADFLWISYIYVSIDLSKNNLFINSL
ncbi:COX15/CtaA family protein [Acidimicrobiaceae bacterium]|nr:COX15/CtaA family protein [Acidimicrobiaceae bacterium]